MVEAVLGSPSSIGRQSLKEKRESHKAMITGTTRLLPLIGHPVGQVRTPESFNLHFTRQGIDAVIFPIEIKPLAVSEFFLNLRNWNNSIGCSVTVPHKQRALEAIDHASERAKLTGAVNIIRREPDGTLWGDMTDGLAMVGAIKAAGHTVSGRCAVVAGAGGGAGAAIAHALCENGIDTLILIETDLARLGRIRETLDDAFPDVSFAESVTDPLGVDIIINATPMGMSPDDAAPFDLEPFSPNAVVADVVTKPVDTQLLVSARHRGMPTVSGLDMIAWQLPYQMQHLGYPDGE